MEPTRILMVDDDSLLRHTTGKALEQAGFETWAATSFEEAVGHLNTRGLPHLVLLEIGLRDGRGLELGRRIEESSDVPVVVLTRLSETEMAALALEQFAEDYIRKPFSSPELVARVRRVLRRMGDFRYTFESTMRVDRRLSVEFARQRVLVDGRHRDLTPTESKLLYILMRGAGRTVRTEFLLRRVWPMQDAFEDSLRVHIHRLRRKIEVAPSRPRYVVTERGVGYRFLMPPDTEGALPRAGGMSAR